MSIHPVRFIFTLPPVIAFTVPPGRHHPCLAACTVAMDGNAMVTIGGPSRERVFEQAARFLRQFYRGGMPLSIAGVVFTDVPPVGQDPWTIIIGADVAFSPTSIEPTLIPESDDDRRQRMRDPPRLIHSAK